MINMHSTVGALALLLQSFLQVTSATSTSSSSEFTLLEQAVTPFLCLAVICGVLLLWLINDDKFSNKYNIFIFLMTISILVFDFSALVFIYYFPMTDSFLWLPILLRSFGVFAFYISSILSYNITHIILYKHEITFNFNKNPVFLFFGFLFFVVPITTYIVVGIIETYFPFQNPALVRFGIWEALSVFFKLFFAVFNVFNYFFCDYKMRQILSEENLKSSSDNSRFKTALAEIVRRMKYYPLCQFLSELPYAIYGLSCPMFFEGFGNDVREERTCFNVFIFALVMVYLNSPFMLFTYLKFSPEALKKLFCYNQDVLNHISSAVISAGDSNQDNIGLSSYKADPSIFIDSIRSRSNDTHGRNISNDTQGRTVSDDSKRTLSASREVRVTSLDNRSGRLDFVSKDSAAGFYNSEMYSLFTEEELFEIISNY